MTTLTDWLDQARARGDAATDGPWSVGFLAEQLRNTVAERWR